MEPATSSFLVRFVSTEPRRELPMGFTLLKTHFQTHPSRKPYQTTEAPLLRRKVKQGKDIGNNRSGGALQLLSKVDITEKMLLDTILIKT